MRIQVSHPYSSTGMMKISKILRPKKYGGPYICSPLPICRERDCVTTRCPGLDLQLKCDLVLSDVQGGLNRATSREGYRFCFSGVQFEGACAAWVDTFTHPGCSISTATCCSDVISMCSTGNIWDHGETGLRDVSGMSPWLWWKGWGRVQSLAWLHDKLGSYVTGYSPAW